MSPNDLKWLDIPEEEITSERKKEKKKSENTKAVIKRKTRVGRVAYVARKDTTHTKKATESQEKKQPPHSCHTTEHGLLYRSASS
jgi:hypothetical protein